MIKSAEKARNTYGGLFRNNEQTGTGAYSLPIFTSPCRGAEPHLSIGYSSTGKDGVFGHGFDLTIGKIERKASHNRPSFDATDRFIISGGEDLVPALKGPVGSPDFTSTRSIVEAGKTYKVSHYRTRTEGKFSRVEHWDNDGAIHWRVRDRHNTLSIYGKSSKAQVRAPRNDSDSTAPKGVLRWLLEETRTATGEHVRYEYAALPALAGEAATPFLQRVWYGNRAYSTKGPEWAFEVYFDYKTRSNAALIEAITSRKKDTAIATERQDVKTTYQAGFAEKSAVLCRNIAMVHHIGDNTPFVVRTQRLTYDETPVLSTLISAVTTGYRHGWKEKTLPPVDFLYTNSTGETEFTKLLDNQGQALDLPILAFADIDTVGLPSILHESGHEIYHAAPLGDGRYDSPEILTYIPLAARKDGAFGLVDLVGDGRHDLVKSTQGSSGYFERDDMGNWAGFTAFPTMPNDVENANMFSVDLTGDGLADKFVIEQNGGHFLRSLGREGFSPPKHVARDDGLNKAPHLPLPLSKNKSRDRKISFVDIFGDGVSHLIEAHHDKILCWPNLGHGRFGQSITFPLPKSLDENFDPERLYFVNINGVGGADLLYFEHNHIQVLINQSGNGFLPRDPIKLPFSFSSSSSVRIADIPGNGQSCVVISDPGNGQLCHWVFNYGAGIKPYALKQITNNMGLEQCIEYTSSTAFHLEDKTAGNPWRSGLANPVWLVSRIEENDLIAGTSSVTDYRYHDGYYSAEDKEFRGFGYVETVHGALPREAKDIWRHPALKGAELAAGGVMRSWYHTGMPTSNGRFEHFYRRTAPQAFSYFKSASTIPELSDFAIGSCEDHFEAARALHGKLMRKEIYDAKAYGAGNAVPFVAIENSFELVHQQSAQGQFKEVVSSRLQSKVSYHFEQLADDPLIEQQIVLLADTFDHPTHAVQIYYPRIVDVVPQNSPQKTTTIHLNYNRFITAVNDDAAYLFGLVAEDQLYDLSPPSRDPHQLYKSSDFKKYVSPNKAPAASSDLELLTWERHIFADQSGAALTNDLNVNRQGLLLYTESAVLPEKINLKPVAEKFTPERLEDDAKYYLQDGYWWEKGIEKLYDWGEATFYQPRGSRDCGNAETSITHSPDRLHVTQITDARGCFHQSDYDTYTQKPKRVTDTNGVVTEMAYDPLGVVVATSVHGFENGRAAGDLALSNEPPIIPADLDSIIAHPNRYLGTATGRTWHDPFAWKRDHTPLVTVKLSRTKHISDDPENEAPVHIEIIYSDGTSRILQHKSIAPAGKAIARGKTGGLITTGSGLKQSFSQIRWRTSGFVVYNNRDNPVLTYNPFFSPDHKFEQDDALAQYGGCEHSTYDALGRLIEKQSAAGFITRTHFTPWGQVAHDAIDTLKDAPRFEDREQIYHASKAEKEVMQVAATQKKPATATEHDALGRVISHKEWVDAHTPLETKFSYDRHGHLAKTHDALGHTALRQAHDLTGQLIYSKSEATGTSITLHTAVGGIVQAWDADGRSIYNHFDKANRPTDQVLFQSDADKDGTVIRRTKYAKLDKAAREQNLAGQPIHVMDESGDTVFEAFSINGAPLQVSRGFLHNPTKLPNWQDSPKLLSERLNVEYAYDGDGRQIEAIYSGSSVISTRYGIDGTLETQSVKDRSGKHHYVVTKTAHTAHGARSRLDLGNKLSQRTTFDHRTGRVERIENRQEGLVQLAFNYVYDPLDNIAKVIEGEVLTRYHYDGGNRFIGSDVTLDGKKIESELFKYDKVGNQLQATRTEPHGQIIRTSKYAPASNHLIAVNCTNEQPLAPQYDSHGNMKALGEGSRYLWDPLQRLRCVDSGNGDPVVWFQYDSLDKVAREVVIAGSAHKHTGEILSDRRHLGPLTVLRQYEYDANGVPKEHKSEKLVLDDSEGQNAVLISQIEPAQKAGVLKFAMTDHLNSTRISVCENESTALAYWAFGEPKNLDTLEDHAQLYSGEEFLAEQGLYNFGARFYAPQLGRWINADPSGMIDGVNQYAFVSNNPIRFRDADGHVKNNAIAPQGGQTRDPNINHNKNAVAPAPAEARPKTQAEVLTEAGAPRGSAMALHRHAVKGPAIQSEMSTSAINSAAMDLGITGGIKRAGLKVGNKAGIINDNTQARINEFHAAVQDFHDKLPKKQRKLMKKSKGEHVACLGLFCMRKAINVGTGNMPLISTILLKPFADMLNSHRADKLREAARMHAEGDGSQMARAHTMVLEAQADALVGEMGPGVTGAMRKLGGGVAEALIDKFTGEYSKIDASNHLVYLASIGFEMDRPGHQVHFAQPVPTVHEHNQRQQLARLPLTMND